MWIVCITSVRHVLTVNGYGGRQTKENEKSWCFKGWETLVPYNHKLVTQLREYGFNSFSRFGKSWECWLPFFLITSVWYLQSDIGSFKQIQLHLGTYISSVPYDCTITIIHFHILQVMNVMHT